MLLPNLFVPGAAKSGTSSLHDYLDQHPNIFMSQTKEPHFFSDATNFQGDHPAKLRQYAALFAEAGNSRYRGESSTGYMVFPGVVDRIQRIVPEPRFIFILRNPIDRAYSHYWWLRGRGYEIRPFREAMLEDIDRSPSPENRVTGFGAYRFYFAFGRYGTYLHPFLQRFGRERTVIITTAQLRADPAATLNACFWRLGLEPVDAMASRRANETIVYRRPWLFRVLNSAGSQTAFSRFLRAKLPEEAFRRLLVSRQALSRRLAALLKSHHTYPPISNRDRQWLRDLYRQEVETLRQITQLEFGEWGRDFPRVAAEVTRVGDRVT